MIGFERVKSNASEEGLIIVLVDFSSLVVHSPALASAGGLHAACIAEQVSLPALGAEFTAEAVGEAAALAAPDERLFLLASAHGLGGAPAVGIALRPRPDARSAVIAARLVVEVSAGAAIEGDASLWLPVRVGIFNGR